MPFEKQSINIFFTYGKHIPEKQHKQQQKESTKRVSQTNKQKNPPLQQL